MEHADLDLSDLYKRFKENITYAQKDNQTVRTLRNTSYNGLSFLAHTAEANFDFIYIDGDHTSAQVMEDAILAWRALKPGGIMAFDDYGWHVAGKSLIETPAPAIDFFLILRGESAEKIWVPENYQVWIRKVGTVDKK